MTNKGCHLVQLGAVVSTKFDRLDRKTTFDHADPHPVRLNSCLELVDLRQVLARATDDDLIHADLGRERQVVVGKGCENRGQFQVHDDRGSVLRLSTTQMLLSPFAIVRDSAILGVGDRD